MQSLRKRRGAGGEVLLTRPRLPRTGARQEQERPGFRERPGGVRRETADTHASSPMAVGTPCSRRGTSSIGPAKRCLSRCPGPRSALPCSTRARLPSSVGAEVGIWNKVPREAIRTKGGRIRRQTRGTPADLSTPTMIWSPAIATPRMLTLLASSISSHVEQLVSRSGVGTLRERGQHARHGPPARAA